MFKKEDKKTIKILANKSLLILSYDAWLIDISTHFYFYPSFCMRKRVLAFDLPPNFVSAQYLENKLAEFHQILYMRSYWQDLVCNRAMAFDWCQNLFLLKFQANCRLRVHRNFYTFKVINRLAFFCLFDKFTCMTNCITINPSIFFFLKMLSTFNVCCIYSSALHTSFYHGSKLYLQYRLEQKQMKEQMKKVMTGRKGVKYKWAVTWDFQQCVMCDQQRLRPACAYAQSDQSLC